MNSVKLNGAYFKVHRHWLLSLPFPVAFSSVFSLHGPVLSLSLWLNFPPFPVLPSPFSLPPSISCLSALCVFIPPPSYSCSKSESTIFPSSKTHSSQGDSGKNKPILPTALLPTMVMNQEHCSNVTGLVVVFVCTAHCYQ